MINWPWVRKTREPQPIPEGTAEVVLHMRYGQKHTQTFKGKPGVTPEEVAREYIRGSGMFFDIGGGKFVSVQDISSITLVKKI